MKKLLHLLVLLGMISSVGILQADSCSAEVDACAAAESNDEWEDEAAADEEVSEGEDGTENEDN